MKGHMNNLPIKRNRYVPRPWFERHPVVRDILIGVALAVGVLIMSVRWPE